jgi:hypothetical protein
LIYDAAKKNRAKIAQIQFCTISWTLREAQKCFELRFQGARRKYDVSGAAVRDGFFAHFFGDFFS